MSVPAPSSHSRINCRVWLGSSSLSTKLAIRWKVRSISRARAATRVKRRAEAGTISVWDCPECWAVCRSQQQACWKCGTPKPREIVIIEQRQAELELIKRLSINDIHDHCRTGEEYVSFAKAKGKTTTFGVLRWLDRKRDAVMAGDPFAELVEGVRPTLDEFVAAAGECGIAPTYARMAGEKMRLQGESMKVFQG